ncbi:isopentenyl phosphate kinase family protein [Candidatus Micrarchaeota archaeon]|nr:isopentenyl phosphate kinase family protein [Candidatus Micrarchaeota archaeon]
MKILKIGGSILTDKSGYKVARPENIKKMAKVISEIWTRGERDLVVVHGAGSFGHPLVVKYKIDNGVSTDEQRYGCAATHSSCNELSGMFVSALVSEGVPAISIVPNLVIQQKNKRIEKLDMEAIRNYVSSGYLPVLYGDMVPDSELGSSVCSGDQIVSYMGKNAELIVLATDVDGVLDSDGNLIPKVTRDNFEQISSHLKERQNDVTGSMKGKLEEIFHMGTKAYIVNAHHPERIIALMKGEEAPSTIVR